MKNETSTVETGEGAPEQRELYFLTDGQEIFQRQEMTETEAREANEVAQRHTAGNVAWYKRNIGA